MKTKLSTRSCKLLVATALFRMVCALPLAAQMPVTLTNASQLNFPATAVGTSSSVQIVLLQATADVTISSITIHQSQGGKQEFSIGTITGCSIGNGVSNPSGTICTLPITFTPAYPGERELPLIVGSGSVAIPGTVSAEFGLTGLGLGPQVALYPGTITTVAGNGFSTGFAGGYSGDNGPAVNAELSDPDDVAVDALGNIYIPDFENNRVRKVGVNGIITTVAGNGIAGFSGDNGPAINAELSGPEDVRVDAAGNIYFVDQINDRVRKVDTNGIITTVAGNGVTGFSGDTGAAINASLDVPEGIFVDAAGSLYITDANNQRVRKVDTNGIITTIAGNGTEGFAGDNGPAINAELAQPGGVAVDAAGNIYIADYANQRIRKIDTSGIITTVAGNGFCFFLNSNGICQAGGYTGDNGPATSAELNNPIEVKVDAADNIYITDTGNQVVRKVDAATGIITTVAGNGVLGFAGDGGVATSGELFAPSGIAVDSLGNFYIADNYNQRIRKVTVTQAALSFPTPTTVGLFDSTDNPQKVTFTNIGNQPLVFAIPSAGTNASISSGFSNDLSSSCAQINSSSSGYSLAAGSSCTYAVDFIPVQGGADSGSLVLTDNALNLAGAKQTIPLNGTGLLIPTTTTLQATPALLAVGQTLTLTATVVAQSGAIPTGTVTFTNGATGLGSATLNGSGIATLLLTPAVGNYSTVASYGGSLTDAASSSAAVPVQVIPHGDFSLVASPNTRTVYTVQKANYTIGIIPTNGFNQPVTLSCSGLPANTTCAFSPAIVTGGSGSSTFTIQTTAPGPVAALNRRNVYLCIAAMGCFCLLLLPLRSRTFRNMRHLFPAILLLLLSASLTGCSTQGKLGNGTPVGTYQLTVIGNATLGSQILTHTTVVTLNVNSLY